MRNVFLSFGMLLFASVVSAQTIVGTNSKYRFDMNSVEFNISGVTRFEMQIDSGLWSSIGLPPAILDPIGGIDNTTFEQPLGTLSVGLHTAAVRACNPDFCSVASNIVSFRFARIPGAPVLRLTPTVVGQGVVRNRYFFQGKDVIDVYFPEINVTLNFVSPTFTIPGVYNVERNDNVGLGFWK